MKANRKNNLKIIAACSVAIFSLMAVMGGAYSWFMLELTQSTDTSNFAVVNVGSCDLYSIDLIKFDYHESTYGSGPNAFTVIDYLNPEKGEVNSYDYDKDLNQFGRIEGGVWEQVSFMNVYDPVDLLIYGGSVKDLNCNSVYKFTVTSNDLTDVQLVASVAKVLDAIASGDNVLFSTCSDFDIYFESDLLDSNPKFSDGDDHKLYYPSYKDKSKSLAALEDIYYKISYLSFLETSHAHFYGDTKDEIFLTDDKELTFVYDSTLDTNVLSFYVNVNYAPDQLEDTMLKIYNENIFAICDFYFKFVFVQEGGDD